MALLARKKILLAKIEATYGTDAAPAGADAVLVSELNLSPLEAQTVQRNNIRPYLGRDLEIHVGEHVKVDFQVEVAGSGTSGASITAPAWGKLMRGCGFAETVDTATAGSEHVRYEPVSSGFESLTLYFNLDGQLHKITGARGTVKVNLGVNQIPHFQFEFTGLYNGPTATPAVTPNFSAFQTPEPAGPGKTSGFSFQGYAGIPISVEIDLANDVVYHQTLTTQEVLITDRKTSGQLTIEAPSVATKDFWADTLANTAGAFAIQQGQTAGNIVLFEAPRVQALQPKYGEADGIATLEMGLAFVPTDAGDDELTIRLI